jgi:hypothetical protein
MYLRTQHPRVPEAVRLSVLRASIFSSLIHGVILSKPVSEVTQDEIVLACRNANILDFIDSLPEFVVMSCLSVFPAINGKFEVVLTPKLVAKALSLSGVRNVCQMYCNPFQPH